jgi:histidinol-phosphate aminotransferase
MPPTAPSATDRLDDLLDLIRPEVRAQHAYRVATQVDDAAKLDQNESPYDLPPKMKRAAVEHFLATDWNRYPSDRPHALVRALAERLDWAPEGLIVGRGSNELTHTVALALVSGGTKVVLPHPMFALYSSVVRVHGGAVVEVDPNPDFSHDADAVIAAMEASQAPLTVVCSPNNPTGYAFPFEDLERMAAAAPGFFLIDEAYVEFVEGPTADELVRRYPNVLLMRTFSKAMGLAGLRLGYLMAHPDLVAEFEKPRLPFLVDRLSEAVGLTVLEHPELVRERVEVMRRERGKMLDALAERDDVETVPSSANFFIMRTPMAPAALRAALLREGARVRDVSGYPALAGYVRVSVGLPAENRAFLDALNEVLA